MESPFQPRRGGGRTTHRLIPTLVVLLTVAAAGCTDSPTPTASSPTQVTPSVQEGSSWTDTQRGTASAELAGLIARAMSDPGLRNRVKNDMRASPFLEHKLALESYLRGERGGILLDKMAQHTGRTKDGVLALLDDLDPLRLEFYMPFYRHRTEWTGGPEVVVATQFDEGQKPAAFTTDGEAYDLEVEELKNAPDRPVLALVPVETDYDDPPPSEAYTNTEDRNGEAIGIYRRVDPTVRASTTILDPTLDGGYDPDEVDWADLPPGLYMSGNWIDDLGEGGLKGDPELEAHLFSPTASNPDVLQDIQCAGQEEPGTFAYDQNGHFYDPKVRVATTEQINDFQSTFGTGEGQGVFLIEDDDTTCEIKMDEGRLQELLDATAEAVDLQDGIKVDLPDEEAEAATLFVRIVNSLANFIQSADDEVGFIVKGENRCAPDGELRFWLIKRGSETNGCTEMRFNDN